MRRVLWREYAIIPIHSSSLGVYSLNALSVFILSLSSLSLDLYILSPCFLSSCSLSPCSVSSLYPLAILSLSILLFSLPWIGSHLFDRLCARSSWTPYDRVPYRHYLACDRMRILNDSVGLSNFGLRILRIDDTRWVTRWIKATESDLLLQSHWIEPTESIESNPLSQIHSFRAIESTESEPLNQIHQVKRRYGRTIQQTIERSNDRYKGGYDHRADSRSPPPSRLNEIIKPRSARSVWWLHYVALHYVEIHWATLCCIKPHNVALSTFKLHYVAIALPNWQAFEIRPKCEHPKKEQTFANRQSSPF